jgi:hypothetical protein
MSIDPIQLLSNISSTSTSSVTSSTSTTSSSTTTDSETSTPISTSAFILDESLASLISEGASGLSGTNLAGYNSRALLTQNLQTLVDSLPSGDETTTSILGNLGNLQSLKIVQAAANATSTTVENGTDVLAFVNGTTTDSSATSEE